MAEAWSENQRSRAVKKLESFSGVCCARKDEVPISPSRTHAKTALKEGVETGELLNFMGSGKI